METRTDHLLDDKGREPGEGGETSISPDGSKVIFEGHCKQGGALGDRATPVHCGFLVAAAGGEPEQVCERCAPRGFTSDGSVVLLQKYDPNDPNKDRIVALDLRTRREQDFLSDPNSPIYQAFFSWDDRWVVFNKVRSWDFRQAHNQTMIAAVRQGSAAKEAEWILLTEGQHSEDKPQFSADGNTVYFTNTRWLSLHLGDPAGPGDQTPAWSTIRLRALSQLKRAGQHFLDGKVKSHRRPRQDPY
jgi:hypothetical protein